MVDQEHVTHRLFEIRDWADYILESLTADQRYEKGKLQVLERMVDGEALREARELARRLAERLNDLVEKADARPVVAA